MPLSDCSPALPTILRQSMDILNQALLAQGGEAVGLQVAETGISYKISKIGRWKRALFTSHSGIESNGLSHLQLNETQSSVSSHTTSPRRRDRASSIPSEVSNRSENEGPVPHIVQVRPVECSEIYKTVGASGQANCMLSKPYRNHTNHTVLHFPEAGRRWYRGLGRVVYQRYQQALALHKGHTLLVRWYGADMSRCKWEIGAARFLEDKVLMCILYVGGLVKCPGQYLAKPSKGLKPQHGQLFDIEILIFMRAASACCSTTLLSHVI